MIPIRALQLREPHIEIFQRAATRCHLLEALAYTEDSTEWVPKYIEAYSSLLTIFYSLIPEYKLPADSELHTISDMWQGLVYYYSLEKAENVQRVPGHLDSYLDLLSWSSLAHSVYPTDLASRTSDFMSMMLQKDAAFRREFKIPDSTRTYDKATNEIVVSPERIGSMPIAIKIPVLPLKEI